MANDFKDLLVTPEEISNIKKNSPESLPLNPTAQGYSGQEVRKKMYMALTGEKGSLLSLIEDRMIKVVDVLENFSERLEVISDYDIMIGVVDVYTESLPLAGFREIDAYVLKEDDKVLVAGLGQELNGIYRVNFDGSWTLVQKTKIHQVVSVSKGDVYGGAMLKKMEDGTTKVVKEPERSTWGLYL